MCETCALFGDCKGHDVRQKSEVASDIKSRMEKLMDTYQNVESQCSTLQDSTLLKIKQESVLSKIKDLKYKATS